jgi:hypothetical protein
VSIRAAFSSLQSEPYKLAPELAVILCRLYSQAFGAVGSAGVIKNRQKIYSFET